MTTRKPPSPINVETAIAAFTQDTVDHLADMACEYDLTGPEVCQMFTDEMARHSGLITAADNAEHVAVEAAADEEYDNVIDLRPRGVA